MNLFKGIMLKTEELQNEEKEEDEVQKLIRLKTEKANFLEKIVSQTEEENNSSGGSEIKKPESPFMSRNVSPLNALAGMFLKQ